LAAALRSIQRLVKNSGRLSVLGSRSATLGGKEDAMQFVITAMAVIAGMVFSFTIALLVEELIFGKVLRVFFAPQVRVQSEQKR
jgi:hypothetical protein